MEQSYLIQLTTFFYQKNNFKNLKNLGTLPPTFHYISLYSFWVQLFSFLYFAEGQTAGHMDGPMVFILKMLPEYGLKYLCTKFGED